MSRQEYTGTSAAIVEGLLEIERDGHLQQMLCAKDSGVLCGDWCPLFNIDENDKDYTFETPYVYLCEAKWRFKTIKFKNKNNAKKEICGWSSYTADEVKFNIGEVI